MSHDSSKLGYSYDDSTEAIYLKALSIPIDEGDQAFEDGGIPLIHLSY